MKGRNTEFFILFWSSWKEILEGIFAALDQEPPNPLLLPHGWQIVIIIIICDSSGNRQTETQCSTSFSHLFLFLDVTVMNICHYWMNGWNTFNLFKGVLPCSFPKQQHYSPVPSFVVGNRCRCQPLTTILNVYWQGFIVSNYTEVPCNVCLLAWPQDIVLYY